MRTDKAAVVLACMAIVVGIGSTVGPVKDMLEQMKAQPAAAVWSAVPGEGNKDLRGVIESKAAQLTAAPVDATVDRVWKAIPGYNGLEVDIEATYRETLLRGNADAIQWVVKQVPAKVTLDDLGAQPIYRGNPAKPMASLMINVAWGNEYIVPILDVLDREKVKATFFLDGSWLSKNKTLAEEIQKRGHELENHAYTHPNMSTLSKARATAEIGKTQKLLKDSLGVDNRWFAPPSGDFDQETVDIAASLGLKTVLWTLDTVDWTKPSPSSIIAKIGAKVEPGSLILMHPTASSSAALKGMIDAIRAKGLKLGTVSETLSPERVLPMKVE